MISPSLRKSSVNRKRFNEALMVPERTVMPDRAYFCPNLGCFTDEVSVRPASSYANVWIVTDEEVDKTWLMVAPRPTCPHCATPLAPVNPERHDGIESELPLM